MDIINKIKFEEFFGAPLSYILMIILLIALFLIVTHFGKKKNKYQIFVYLLVIFVPVIIYAQIVSNCSGVSCMRQMFILPMLVVLALGVLIFHIFWGRK